MNDVPTIDAMRWPQVSARLDELLDLAPAEQQARLEALRAEDPALAQDLAAMLVRMQELDDKDFLAAPAMPQPAGLGGQTVGAYTLERELGHGGMGSVWLARRTDGRYEGQVAIKFLQAGLFGSGGVARFEREGSILARLDHPHIARLLDAGVSPDTHQPYLVLEYIDGEPIDRYCIHRAPGTEALIRLFLDVLAAVAHAHARLILHRDLKPSNILVTNAGEVKLLDFGIAKLLDDATRPGAASDLTHQAGNAYTPHFATPEQIQGAEVTTATDVYALGVLLYLLLSGRHPTLGEAEGELDRLRAVIEVEPRRLSDAVLRQGGPLAEKRAREARGDLDTILAKAMKKAPAERYANAADLAEDLRRYLDHEPIAARPDTPAYVIGKYVRRHRVGVAAGSTAVLALVIGIGVALQQGQEARRQRAQAEGLIGFMLGDLRKKLTPVGRLDALDAVGAKVLGYYAAQDADKLDAGSLAQRASALHLIGEIAESRGQLEESARSFRQAAETTARQLAAAPDDPQRIFDQAQSEYWVGFVAWRRGEFKEAEARFGRYLAHARVLTARDPANLDWQAELAWARQNLAVVYISVSRLPEALAALTESRAIWDRLVGTRPQVWRELGTTLGWLARVHDDMGDYQRAVLLEREKMAAARKQPNAESDKGVQYLLANGQQVNARRLLALGQVDAARRAADEALTSFIALAGRDPSNLEWQSQVAIGRLLLIEAKLATGDGSTAPAELKLVDDTVKRLLAAKSADKISWQVFVRGRALLARARLAMQPATLQADLAAFLTDSRRFETADKALPPEGQRVFSSVGLVLGDLLVEAGAPEQAQQHWATAAQRLRGLVDLGDLPAIALRTLLLLRMGEVDEARSLAQRLQSSNYRHPQVAEIRRRLAKVGANLPLN